MITANREAYSERYRPQFHFSPMRGWMNDPNGMVYYDGEYHLFYQHIPETVKFPGHMHWGHAVSTDLLHWQHLPIALFPDQHGDIWSGSAVVDWQNSSGFQTGAEKVLVAIFTHSSEAGQRQSIAYSNDRGRTWTSYVDNPVIANPGLQDFRDPKVFWHEKTRHWVMILAAGDRILLYTSSNLREWSLASEFGKLEGSHEGMWECPDLFELPVETNSRDTNHGATKWVMLVSVSNGSPNGGSGTQYFIGDFDGRTFTNDYPAAKVLWLDHGKDNYAGVTFSDVPSEDGRRIFLGWMSNWSYAADVPTIPWRGAMTLPRHLVLRSSDAGQYQLASLPVAELQALRGTQTRINKQIIPDRATVVVTDDLSSGIFEIVVEYEWKTTSEFGLILRNSESEQTRIGYNVLAQKLFIDRRQSGLIDFKHASLMDFSFGDSGVIDFSGGFALGLHAAPLFSKSDSVKLQVFVDRSSVEVFADDGRVLITSLVLPQRAYNRVEFFGDGGAVTVLNCEIWEMETVWKGGGDSC